MTRRDHSHLERHLGRLLSGDVVATAAAYADGERCLRVVHGHVETPEEDAALNEVAAAIPEVLARHAAAGQHLRTCSTGDSTMWWFGSTPAVHATVLVKDLESVVRARAMSWWRISHDPA